MIKARAVYVVILALLSACGQNPPPKSTNGAATNSQGTPPKDNNPTSPNCSCTEFPFPDPCRSQCEVGEATVQSVNPVAGTAQVMIEHGAQKELRTIPLSELPAHLTQEKDSQFKILLKKDAAAPNSPRIVRSIGGVK